VSQTQAYTFPRDLRDSRHGVCLEGCWCSTLLDLATPEKSMDA